MSSSNNPPVNNRWPPQNSTTTSTTTSQSNSPPPLPSRPTKPTRSMSAFPGLDQSLNSNNTCSTTQSLSIKRQSEQRGHVISGDNQSSHERNSSSSSVSRASMTSSTVKSTNFSSIRNQIASAFQNNSSTSATSLLSLPSSSNNESSSLVKPSAILSPRNSNHTQPSVTSNSFHGNSSSHSVASTQASSSSSIFLKNTQQQQNRDLITPNSTTTSTSSTTTTRENRLVRSSLNSSSSNLENHQHTPQTTMWPKLRPTNSNINNNNNTVMDSSSLGSEMSSSSLHKNPLIKQEEEEKKTVSPPPVPPKTRFGTVLLPSNSSLHSSSTGTSVSSSSSTSTSTASSPSHAQKEQNNQLSPRSAPLDSHSATQKEDFPRTTTTKTSPRSHHSSTTGGPNDHSQQSPSSKTVFNHASKVSEQQEPQTTSPSWVLNRKGHSDHTSPVSSSSSFSRQWPPQKNQEEASTPTTPTTQQMHSMVESNSSPTSSAPTNKAFSAGVSNGSGASPTNRLMWNTKKQHFDMNQEQQQKNDSTTPSKSVVGNSSNDASPSTPPPLPSLLRKPTMKIASSPGTLATTTTPGISALNNVLENQSSSPVTLVTTPSSLDSSPTPSSPSSRFQFKPPPPSVPSLSLNERETPPKTSKNSLVSPRSNSLLNKDCLVNNSDFLQSETTNLRSDIQNSSQTIPFKKPPPLQPSNSTGSLSSSSGSNSNSPVPPIPERKPSSARLSPRESIYSTATSTTTYSLEENSSKSNNSQKKKGLDQDSSSTSTPSTSPISTSCDSSNTLFSMQKIEGIIINSANEPEDTSSAHDVESDGEADDDFAEDQESFGSSKNLFDLDSFTVSSLGKFKSMNTSSYHRSKKPQRSRSNDYAQQPQQRQQQQLQERVTLDQNFETILPSYVIETKIKPWSQTDSSLSPEEETALSQNKYAHPNLRNAFKAFNEPFRIMKCIEPPYCSIPFRPTFDDTYDTATSISSTTDSRSRSNSNSYFRPSTETPEDLEIEEEQSGAQSFGAFLAKLKEVNSNDEYDGASPRTVFLRQSNKYTVGRSQKVTEGFDEMVLSDRKKSLFEFVKATIAKKTTDIIENIEPKNGTVMTLKEVGLDQITENITSKTRLVSCLKPDYKFKPLDASLCQRSNDVPYPVKRKTKFFLQCSNLRFLDNTQMKDRELLFMTIALYDTHAGRKISEDYHFHLMPSHQFIGVSETIKRDLSLYDASLNSMFSTKKLFSVSYPNDQIYVVAFVYRIPTSTTKDAAKMYSKDAKNVDKWFEKYEEFKPKLCRHRQPFLFSFAPLFEKELMDIKGKQVDTFKLSSSKIDLKPFYEIEGDWKNPMDVITTIRNSLKEKKTKNNQISGVMTLNVELYSNASAQSNYEIQQRVTQQRHRPSNILSRTDSDSSLGSGSPLSHASSRADSMFDRQNAHEMEQLSYDVIQEFPLLFSNYPNLAIQNTLFIYPIAFSIEGSKSAKNVFVEVYFRNNDVIPPGINDINDPYSEKRFITWLKREKSHSLLTALSYDEKQQQLFDEFRLELPLVPNYKHHLLFVFYHMDIDNKRSKKLEYANPANDARQDFFGTSDRAVIGYSFLPLTRSVQNDNPHYKMGENIAFCNKISTELNVFKKDTFLSNYLSGEGLRAIKNAKLVVKTKLVSTLYPRDNFLTLFYCVMTDLYTLPLFKTNEVLGYLANELLLRFNEIDFSEFMPHFPVVMNMLFELMGRIRELSSSSKLVDRIEQDALDAVITCLRGAYEYTKLHSRGNKFFTSYIKYIFAPEQSLSMILPHIFIKLLRSALREGDSSQDTRYIDEKFGKKKFSTVKKSVSTSEKKEDDQHYDIIKFSWFIFDAIVKSVALDCANNSEATDYQSSNTMNYFNSEQDELAFVGLIESVMDNFNNCVNKLMLTEVANKNNIGLNGNRNLALFIRDLIPMLHRRNIVKLLQKYFSFFNGSDEKQLNLKIEFIAILSDYEYWIPLNSLSLEEGNFGIRHFSNLFYQIVDTNKDKLVKKISKVLLNHLCKLDYDSRYNDDSEKALVCELYLGFVDAFFERDASLPYLQNDDLYVVTSCTILWIMRGLSQRRLVEWFKAQPYYKTSNILNFLDSFTIAINNLDYNAKTPKERELKDDRTLRTEVILIIHYLISVITSLHIPDYDLIKELEMQSDNIELLANIPLNDPSLLRQRQLVSDYESLKVTSQRPIVSLFFRQVCRLLMNAVLQLTLRKELELCYIVFRESIFPLICDCTSHLVLSELYDNSIPKKERVPIAEKRRIEQKWRWLLGAVMLHAGFTSEEEENAYPIVRKCYELLLAPFKNKKFDAILEDSTSEEGDLMLNTDDNNIKAGTFKRLVERLLDVNTNSVDKEGNRFADIFLLTCTSFASPMLLLQQIIEIFKNTEDAVIKLRVEQFISKWVRFGFHDFDNLLIARLVSFLSNISAVTQKKIKKYIIKHFLHVKMENYGDLNNISPNPQIPKNIPKEKLEEPEMDVKKWKEAKKFTKQLENPFNLKFELLDWPSLEIARQLTLIESKLFRKIEAKEFFGSAWTDKEYKQELAPTLCAITERTNNISFWVRNKILMESNLEVRRKIMKKFVDILRELKELRNYTSMIQITSAFNSAEIHRLKKTKEGLSKQDLELIEECSNLVSNNSKSLREQLEREVIINGAPAVPVVAIYFTDLVFIEDGNPDTFEHKMNRNKKLINFQKRRLYYNAVNTIKTLQTKSKYSLQPLPYLQYILKEEILQNLKTDEKMLFDLSLKIEPRTNK
ncbi:hypothetical protein C9374_003279 [Naegleria lovaniensis]|uniref:C2 DOCK-type domain-containing protein n=1 Tax=Naegleria lovaniensis TaxID=51637 RepID=A0AA88KL43_NAELO|nr:uncharacterized protein C9374_003279 [Naegleria lovaniensis]KAG2385464.1 hypothetical protein C9374_003279 [Naegleria lovaniensis]